MSEPALKCKNNFIFKQNYTLELFIALEMAYCCCLGLRQNLDFPDSPKKSFITLTTAPAEISQLFDCTCQWLKVYSRQL